MIKHVNFQLYRVNHARGIWEKPAMEEDYINKLVQVFADQMVCL